MGNNPGTFTDPLGLKSDNRWWPKEIEPFINYGNYGGPVNTDPTYTRPPSDQMDRLFLRHDQGWEAGQIEQANRDLYYGLRNLPWNPNGWNPPAPDLAKALAYRAAAQTVFGAVELFSEERARNEQKFLFGEIPYLGQRKNEREWKKKK